MNPPLTSLEIQTRLDAVRSIIRRTQRSRALFLIITTAIGGLLLGMLLDFVFSPLPAGARWVVFTVWVAAVLGVALRALSPLRREIPLVRIARWLEERHPEMQERLSTVIELAASPGGVSQELLGEIARAAGNDIHSVDPKSEVRSARRRRQWKAPALFVTAVLMLSLAVWPGQVWRLLVRTLAPFSDVGTAGAVRFTIKPGNIELLEDDPLQVAFTVSGNNPRPQVRISTLGGIETTQAAEVDGDGFRFTLAPVRESLHYQVVEGRDVSDTFNATVLPVPSLSNTRAKLRFPSYTSLPESEMDPARGIEAIAGTVVILTASLNTPIEAAWIEQEGKRLCDGSIQPTSGGGTLAFECELSGNTSGQAVVVLKHRLRPRIEAATFEVKVLDDMPPQVLVLSPESNELRVRPAETLRLRYEITEDHAVAGLSLDAEGSGDTAAFPQTLPERYGTSRPLRFRGEVPMSVGELRDRFPGANEFRIRLTARDGRPASLGGPGTGHSDWIRIRIEQDAPSLARQELQAQREETRSAIEEAIRDAREAKQQANRAENRMRQKDPGKDVAEAIEKAAEKLTSSEKIAEEAAAELKESLHADKADELEAAAETLADARERIENAPLQDTPEERGNQLREADQEIQQAIRELEKVRDAIERDQQRAEDTVALQELADEQAELARQAEANENSKDQVAANEQPAQADNPVEPDSAEQEAAPPKPWSEQQAQVARELQKEVAERADAKAASLEAQAEKARELAREADSLAKEQSELAKQSEQASGESPPGDSPSAEALAERQEAQAEAAADLAEQVESLPATQSNPSAQQASQAARQAAKASSEAAEKVAEASEPPAQDAGEQGKPAGSAPPSSDSGKTAAEDSASESQSNKNAPAEPMTPAQQAAAKNAAPLNQQAAGQLAKTAEALRQAAEQFEQAAENAAAQAAAAAQRPAPQGQATAPAGALAEALAAASAAAATSEAGTAAEQSAAAAAALAQAAQAAQQAMRGQSPGKSGEAPSSAPGQPDQPGMPPGESTPMANFRQQGADPGVPPELAKLGISADDWERIKAALAADVGSTEAEGIPAEYRSLVKDYFQNLSKTPSNKP